LPHAQAEDEQDEEARLEIIDSRRGFVMAQLADAMQKRSDHQQHAAAQAPDLETGQAALFNQPVKLGQPEARQENHDDQEDVIRDEFVAREERREDHRPQNHRADQSAEENFRLRRRSGGSGVRRGRFDL